MMYIGVFVLLLKNYERGNECVHQINDHYIYIYVRL